MQLSPRMRAFLDRLGVNTTRLNWKLYEWERRRENRDKVSRLPSSLQWLQYPHKFCPNCRAVVDREERVCPRCNRRVHSMAVYRTMRLLGLVGVGGSAPTIYVFLTVMVVVFLVSILLDGISALGRPNRQTLLLLGAWSPKEILVWGQYWRMMSFGLAHIGLLHILFNGMALTQVGPIIEDEIGRARMLVVITLTQLTCAIATHYWYIHVLGFGGAITAGASGWLFGLLGYGIGHFHRSGGAARQHRDFFVRWAIYGILFGFLIGANNAAHVGGMVGGMILGVVPSQRRRWAHIWNPLWQAGFWLSAALWLITVGFMVRYFVMNWTPGGEAL